MTRRSEWPGRAGSNRRNETRNTFRPTRELQPRERVKEETLRSAGTFFRLYAFRLQGSLGSTNELARTPMRWQSCDWQVPRH